MLPFPDDDEERRPLNAGAADAASRRLFGDWRGVSSAIVNVSTRIRALHAAMQATGANDEQQMMNRADDDIDSDGGVPDPPGALAMRVGGAAGPNNGRQPPFQQQQPPQQQGQGQGQQQQQTGDAVPSNMTRWVEDTMPFVTLLLMVFLYKHLLSLLTFFWLTSLLHDANERIRGQSLLKENRSRRRSSACRCFSSRSPSALPAQWAAPLSAAAVPRGDDLCRAAQPHHRLVGRPIADLCARSALSSGRHCSRSPPASAVRRLRNVNTAVELFGACYRLPLPMPLWFHWLTHAAVDDDSVNGSGPTLWSVGVSHLYCGFKFIAFFERSRRAAHAARAAVWSSLPVGKYASEEELLELGEDGCTICQEVHAAPVRLSCGHIFCEECITSWCERRAGHGATCPLCRAPVITTIGPHADGTTTLLPLLF